MPLRRGATALLHEKEKVQAEECHSSSRIDKRNKGTVAVLTVGLSRHKLTKVILSCLPLIVILLLLAVFTSTSESASLNAKSSPTSSSSQTTKYEDENARITPRSQQYQPRLSTYHQGASYLYEIPPAPTYNTKKPPNVNLRLSSESGILNRRNNPVALVNEEKATEKSAKHPTIFVKKAQKPEESDFSVEDENKYPDEDPGDYPYQFYLDYETSMQQQPSSSGSNKDKGDFISSPSETILHQSQQQNHLWNDYLSQASTSPSPQNPLNYKSFDENSNEVHESSDNYTIPSLKDYKFPEFKATNKPHKSNYLSPYEFFSEEDFENVADLEDDHSKYFVKTKPRDVSSSVSNLYNSFYYEPPSYSTKTQPLPVKANFPSAGLPDDFKFDANHKELKYTELVDESGFYSPLQTTPMSPILPEEISTKPTMTSTVTINPFMPESTLTPSIQSQRNLEFNPSRDSSTAESILSSLSVVTPKDNAITTDFNLISNIASKYATSDATSIPGMPGIDYPIFDEVPITSFDCKKQRYKGFFADMDTKCQAWHYCDFTDGHSTFLCPNGTLFSQVLLTCDWWFNVDCKQAQQLYVLNERLYRYIKPPKPSFPEDYHGPQVDLWLLKQLELGLLPKIKKKGKLVDKPSGTGTQTAV